MSEIVNPELSGIPETALAPLFIRAMETQRPEALIKDEKAVESVTRISYDFDRIKQVPGSEAYNTVRVLVGRELDRLGRQKVISISTTQAKG